MGKNNQAEQYLLDFEVAQGSLAVEACRSAPKQKRQLLRLTLTQEGKGYTLKDSAKAGPTLSRRY